MSFDDLLAANRTYADSFALRGFDGIARAGVAMVTCMDSRLEPLEMIGLTVGDAKILRTPGGHVTRAALRGCILAVHLLNVERILVVAHTKCAMAKGEDIDLVQAIKDRTGADVSRLPFHATTDQLGRLHADVEMLRTHEFLAGRCEVGGFVYDVDTGLLTQHC